MTRHPMLRFRDPYPDDPLAEARGILVGALLGTVIWAVFLIWWFLT